MTFETKQNAQFIKASVPFPNYSLLPHFEMDMEMLDCVRGTVMRALLTLSARSLSASAIVCSFLLPTPVECIVEKDAQPEDKRHQHQSNQQMWVYGHNMHLYAPFSRRLRSAHSMPSFCKEWKESTPFFCS